jgi:hypothetical protein
MNARQNREQPIRGFVFWATAPFLLAFVTLMPLLIEIRDVKAFIALVAVETLAILALVTLFDSVRFRWAGRGVGAIIFVGYLAYLIAMLVEGGGQIVPAARKSEVTAFNAACGLFAFGLPGLCYALFGRFTFRPEVPEDDAAEVLDDVDELDEDNRPV